MFQLTRIFRNHNINCSAINMGTDWNISIYGGEISHIGAVALGIPRLSLDGSNKISSSVSVLTITGHKEDIIVQNVAKKICSKINSTVVVCCGIHIKDITFDEIENLNYVIDELVEELILKISGGCK
ncbi:hypothetical protein [Clostridium gasigenes]|uniref:Prenylated flavin chaperone LpdD-like domain-containing protein n=1 Tax=Clostridium gasigenes TaxID=94869 RepID=A0A7X0SEE1_9CLOT|nr:hypothetical protein [Clostridium gasigenes]MBB6714026.1 hypothetical protein [Clostridium gasigenes]